jgi:hypothetical protein
MELVGSVTAAESTSPVARVVRLGGGDRLNSQTATDNEKPRRGSGKRKKEFLTPYAPAVLTLRRPSAAISLG